jgi:hypothetical protein
VGERIATGRRKLYEKQNNSDFFSFKSQTLFVLADMSAQRRLFISGLPDDVTKAQIIQRFESFMEGKEAQVDLKMNPTTNEPFAFVSLALSDENLTKCRNLYKKAKWKGKLMRYFVRNPR